MPQQRHSISDQIAEVETFSVWQVCETNSRRNRLHVRIHDRDLQKGQQGKQITAALNGVTENMGDGATEHETQVNVLKDQQHFPRTNQWTQNSFDWPSKTGSKVGYISGYTSVV